MPIPLVVAKRYEGQRVTSWWQPATQTNRDPIRDKKLCGSTSNGTDQYQNGSSNLLTPYREQSRSTRNVVAYPRPAFSAKKRKNYAPTSFDQQFQVSQGHTFCTEIRKIEIPRSMVVEALNWWSRRASQHPAVQSPVHSWKSPMNLARSPLLVALVERKMTVVRDQLFPQKPPGSSLWFSRTGVQPSPGSSAIELPSAFAESGAYPPDSRVLPGSPRQCSLPLACRHPPEGHQIGAREEARTWEHHHPQPTIPPPRLNRQAESRRQPVGCISWGWARPYTRRKDPPTLIPRNQQVSEGAGTRAVHLKYWRYTYPSLLRPRSKVTGFFTHLPSAVRALIFLAREIQPFLSLVDREVEFCVLTI